MSLKFIDLNGEDSDITNIYELQELMPCNDVYITTLRIGNEIRQFPTYENPFSLFCEPFEYDDFQLISQTLVLDKLYPSSLLDIPRLLETAGRFKRERSVKEQFYFNQMSDIDFKKVKELKLYNIVDANGQNVLFVTANDVNLTIEIIKAFDIGFCTDNYGNDAFKDIDQETLQKYFFFGLHKIVKELPKSVFKMLNIEHLLEDYDLKGIKFYTCNETPKKKSKDVCILLSKENLKAEIQYPVYKELEEVKAMKALERNTEVAQFITINCQDTSEVFRYKVPKEGWRGCIRRFLKKRPQYRFTSYTEFERNTVTYSLD